VRFLGYSDGSLEVSLGLRRSIARVIRTSGQIAWSANHLSATGTVSARVTPDHLAAGEATLQAVYPDARNPYCYPRAARGRLRASRCGGGLAHGLATRDPPPWTSRRRSSARSRLCGAIKASWFDPESLEEMIRSWGSANRCGSGTAEGRFAESFQVVRHSLKARPRAGSARPDPSRTSPCRSSTCGEELSETTPGLWSDAGLAGAGATLKIRPPDGPG